ncbi:DUF6240 domain-containing protein [Defluviitalea phaphyphila]|uniref:DUF6240 domain-containing protein n=1 Tax=Defluviitalea phaphyphila TaxID=1473580 RepID=UPI000731D9D1|nr:DUF6240 domain-containing protein [Defluviitalea phaphyphila]
MVSQIQNRDIVINKNQIDCSNPIEEEWIEGEILNGEIVSKGQETMTIEIQGSQFLVKANEDYDIGDEIKLEVKKVVDNEVYLKIYEEDKNIRSIKQYDNLRSILKKESIPISKQNLEIAKSMIDSGIEIEKEIFEKVIATKQKIDEIINTMTKKEIKELLESPYDIEKISIDIISRFLSKDNLSKELVSKEKIEEEFKKFTNDKTMGIKDIIKVLLENGLPVTRKNINHLLSVKEKIEAIKNISNEAIFQAIKKDLSLTINNLYTYIFSSSKVDTTNYYATDEEIKDILEYQNIPTKKEYIEAARLLIENNEEIDDKKVESIISLKEAIKNLDEDSLLNKSVQLLKENKNPGSVEIFNTHSDKSYLTEEEVNSLVKDIPKIDDEIIKRILKKNLPINFKNLREEINNQSNIETIDIKENDTNFITIKRQLEEIRLKMTLEAAKKLNQKIEINTAPLEEIVENLRELEKEYYRDCLKKAGAETSTENIEKLKEVYDKIEVVKKLDENVLPKVIRKEISFVIDDLYKEQLAVSKYEEAHTKPDLRFGDNIKKVYDQIAPLLIEKGIEATDENIRCARILIQNNMELNEENLIHLKFLDQKVNYVVKKLHPIIAANMIKEGFRPDKLPIDNVIEYMNRFDELLGEDLTGKLEKLILQMDEEKILSQNEREGIIGIYRMLNTIEKSEGKVIGWLMKNNMKLTLSNLMEGAKYLSRTLGKNEDINVAVDDNFGFSEEVIFPEKSIKAQLDKAFVDSSNENMRENYAKSIFNDFIKSLSIDKLQELMDKGLLSEDLENIYKEYVREGLLENNIEEKYINEFIDRISNLKNINKETLLFMERNKIPINLKNLESISSIFDDPYIFGDDLNKFNNITKEFNKDNLEEVIKDNINQLKQGKEIEEVLDTLKQKVKEIRSQLLESFSNKKQDVWKLGGDIENIIDIQNQMQDEIYQIPVLLNGKIANINVYFMKEKKGKNTANPNSINALVTMKTENMGNIKMNIKMNDFNVDFKITGENEEITDYLKNYEDNIKAVIENMGYKVKIGLYTEESKESNNHQILSPVRKNLDSDFEIVV